MKRYISDYSVLCDETDDTLAVVEAIKKLDDGDELILENRVYNFYPDFAFEKEYLFLTDSTSLKKCVFLLRGKKNITIDGNGAELIFHGEIVLFAVDGCENVIIKNCIVDYASPFFSQADIIEADEKHAVLKFDTSETQCGTNNGRLYFYSESDNWNVSLDRVLALEFNAERCAPEIYQPTYFACFEADTKEKGYANFNRILNAEENEDGNIILTGNFGFSHAKGNKWVCTYGVCQCCTVMIENSLNTEISDLTIYHSPSIGIAVQNSEKILIKGLNTVRREGSERLITLNSDAVSIIGCRGDIEIRDSIINNTMSDGISIRRAQTRIYKMADSRTLYIYNGEGMNCVRAGDTVRLSDENGALICNLSVKSADAYTGKYTRVEFCKDIPTDMVTEDCIFEDLSAFPDVIVSGCKIGNNRPHSISLNTPKNTVIENCIFYSMYAAVKVECRGRGSEEYGGMGKLVVKNNIFDNAAYAGGHMIQIDRSEYSGEIDEEYHKDISIKDNLFISPRHRFISAYSVKNFDFCGNRYIESKAACAVSDNGDEDEICVDCCKNVNIEYPDEQNPDEKKM